MYLLEVRRPARRKYPKGEIVNILFDSEVCLDIAKAQCRVKFNEINLDFRVVTELDDYTVSSHRI